MNLIIMILLISLLILVHEAGHFFAAKLFKIKVDKFGFGLPFGPTLFRKKIGETEFLIHSFLLGGYVSFPDDDESSELPKDSPLRFKNKPIYQRVIVVIAGVVANFLFAVLLVFLTGLVWGKLPSNTYDIEISKITPSATESVKKSGLQKGDIIYSINGSRADIPVVLAKYRAHSIPFDGSVDESIVKNKEKEIIKLNPKIDPTKAIKKGTKVFLPEFKDENPIKFTYDEIIGFEQYKNNDITLTEDQRKLRDEICKKKSFVVDSPLSLQDVAISSSDTQRPLSIVVVRDGKKIDIGNIYLNQNGFLGIENTVKEKFIPTKNPIDLIKSTFVYVNYNVSLMTYGLGKLFMGRIPVQEMHGIVAITKIGSDVIEYQGLFKGLLLTALISINLAIINLLPIPALDGGHLLFLIIEKIRGKALNEKIMEAIGNIFFYTLIVLMVLIIFNDVFALVTKQI